MNTDKYLALFDYALSAGDIPEDLYDFLISEVEKEGRMTRRIYGIYLDELERRRLFETDGTMFDTKNSAVTDGNYVYKRPKNPFWHIAHAVTATIFKLLSYVASAIGFGVWRIKDRKKLKKIGPCVTVSNHIGYLDSLLTRRALGMRKQYIIAAPHNCKNTLGGKILKAAIVIPLPSKMSGNRPFVDMLEYVKDRGGAIHFYAEKSMWLRYKKPRPYKEGAFFYADKLDVPVVPMFFCYERARGLRAFLHMPKMKVRIGDPVYPDKSLPSRIRKTDIGERAFAEAKAMYEDHYKIPLEYLDISGTKVIQSEKQGEENG